MSKKILGIFNGKNASITYFDGDKIAFSVCEERFNRIKNYRGYPFKSINYLFKKFKLNPLEIEVVTSGAWNSPGKDVLKDYFKINNRCFEPWSRLFYSEISDHKYKIEFIKETIKIFKNAEIKFYDHHISHFFSAKLTFQHKNGYGIVSDGRGDCQSLSLWKFSPTKIIKLAGFSELRSFGAFYGSITYLLGFIPDRHEGKVTGLAAYGKKTQLVNKFKNYINFHKGQINTSNEFIPFTKPNNLNYLKRITRGYSKEDIAFAAQYNLEKNIIKIIDYYIPKNSNLVAAGGVFSNVKLNQKIRETNHCKNFYIFPEMSDAGISFGSVSAYLYEKSLVPKKIKDMFLGPENLIKYKDKKKLRSRKLDKKINFNFILSELQKGKVIGICNGKGEFGPRALGNRSIIFSPSEIKLKDKVNKRLGRNDFMPFAPVTIDQLAKKLFINYKKNDQNLQFMTTCYRCSKLMIKKCPSVVHVDKTARPQVLTKKFKNKMYYNLVYGFNKKYGIPCLINTSFNVHEEPIVNTTEEAIFMLKKKVIDYLIVDNLLLSIK
jgi:carbamoyltransferase